MKTQEYLFRERLLPSLWVFLLALALISMFAIAVGAAYSPVQGWLVFLIVGSLSGAGLFLGAPVIAVSTRELRAGRATISRSFLGNIEALDGMQTRAAQNIATRYLLVRPWRTSGGVLVHLIDELDPHPAWLLSTKDPARLAAALQPDNLVG
ncbi:MAG: DUF3093 domain-containing protein [Candidatus Nanopelagicales bacterium]|nr:DUF3093 domain-containing protein [Candidatus Nanopelagicales bacterium]